MPAQLKMSQGSRSKSRRFNLNIHEIDPGKHKSDYKMQALNRLILLRNESESFLST